MKDRKILQKTAKYHEKSLQIMNNLKISRKMTKYDEISRKTVKYDKRSRNFAKDPETP
jgi:hypothetical protein